MISKKTKVKAKAGAKLAAAMAGVSGKKIASKLVEAGDAALMKLTEGARKRKRNRRLKAVGKAVLVAGAAAGAVVAGRAALRRAR
jgi:hypothetical protein